MKTSRRKRPSPKGGRGHWLEAAVLASLSIYRSRGIATVQRIATPAGHRKDGSFYRSASTVDFLGVFRGLPIAFDCKVVRTASLPHRNVHPHQIDFLLDFKSAGGLAGILVAFEDHGTGSFWANIEWYTQMKAELHDRVSIPETAFAHAALDPAQDCYHVPHGTDGVPVCLEKALKGADGFW